MLSIVLRPNTRGVSWWVPDLPDWAPLVLTLLLWVTIVGALVGRWASARETRREFIRFLRGRMRR